MLRSSCLLRVGAHRIEGLWSPGRSGGLPVHASCYFEGDGTLADSALGDAISSVLRRILPKRRLASPNVSVGVAGSYVRAAIMAFAKLPKGVNDRTLLISQRFCREHRLDPATVAVQGCALGPSKAGEEAVLCVALPQALLAQIRRRLSENGLHADLVAPDYMLSFAGTDTRRLQAPGMVLLGGDDGVAILVWDTQKRIVHVAALAAGLEETVADGRLVPRISRYARVVGAEGSEVTVYAGQAMLHALETAEVLRRGGLKLIRWPGRGFEAQLHMGAVQ